MSILWKETKSYSKSAAEFAAAPVAFAGGLIGKGATVTSVSTATATTVGTGATVTTTTLTTATAGFATAAAGVALAAAAGTAAGQLINGGLSFFWDPEPIDTDLVCFEQISNQDVDAFLDSLFNKPAYKLLYPGGQLTLRSIDSGETYIPNLCTASVDLARIAVRTLVHVLRGAAFGTCGNRKQVRTAGRVVGQDLQCFTERLRKFAILLKKNQAVSSIYPTISLNAYLRFIEDHKQRGRHAIPPVESAIIADIGDLAGVDFRENFDNRIARWVAEGPDTGEIAAFRNTADNSLAVADILLESLVWCWSGFDIYASEYLQS